MPLLLVLLISACGSDPEPLTCAEGELMDGDACVPEACGTGTWGDLDTDGPGLYLVTEATLDCTDCTLTDNAFAGAVVQGGGVVEPGKSPSARVLQHNLDATEDPCACSLHCSWACSPFRPSRLRMGRLRPTS